MRLFNLRSNLTHSQFHSGVSGQFGSLLMMLQFLLFTTLVAIQGYGSKTHMSTVEMWNNDTVNGYVVIAHGINSWPALLDQLNEPILERSTIIEGDVLLYKQRKHRNRAIPLMSAPQRVADRITFKEWLREVAKLKKVIKINVRSTEAVRPVLQYLFAASDEIVSPVVLHANILRSVRSSEKPVDANEFLDGSRKYFPEATLSIGWTKTNISELTITQRKINWRDVFHIFSLIKRLEQPIMISARLSVVENSAPQISFILGVRPEISVFVWSDENDIVDNWDDLILLRSSPYSKRIVFDLNPSHAEIVRVLPYKLSINQQSFERKHWRNIEFPSPSTITSGIVMSDEGVAFIGWPNAFLISTVRPPMFPNHQTVSAELTFVRKHGVRKGDWLQSTGLSIFLLLKVDLQSPDIRSGIKVFIGYDGRLLIENRDTIADGYNIKAIGQLRFHQCYFIEMIDRGWRVELIGVALDCKTKEELSYSHITLDTPLTKSRQLRNVILSKTGHHGVDILVQNLRYSSSSHLEFPLLFLALILFLRMF